MFYSLVAFEFSFWAENGNNLDVACQVDGVAVSKSLSLEAVLAQGCRSLEAFLLFAVV